MLRFGVFPDKAVATNRYTACDAEKMQPFSFMSLTHGNTFLFLHLRFVFFRHVFQPKISLQASQSALRYKSNLSAFWTINFRLFSDPVLQTLKTVNVLAIKIFGFSKKIKANTTSQIFFQIGESRTCTVTCRCHVIFKHKSSFFVMPIFSSLFSMRIWRLVFCWLYIKPPSAIRWLYIKLLTAILATTSQHYTSLCTLVLLCSAVNAMISVRHK